MPTNIIPTAPSTPRSGASNMNRRYALTRNQLNDLLTEMNTQTFIDDITLLFATPIENVVALYAYPFDVKALSPAWSVPDDGPIIINIVTMESVGCDLANIPVPLLDCGSLSITRQFNNFLDFAPYTKLEIFLPYIGYETLDTDLVMDKTINVKYAVDLYSGKCTAFITTTDGTDTCLIMTREGQIGMPIQIAGGSGAELSRNMLRTGLSATAGAASLATGAIAAGASDSGGKTPSVVQTIGGSVGYLAGTSSAAIGAGQYPIHKGGSTVALNSFYAPQKCFIIRTTPKAAEPLTYAHNVGYPSGKTATLGDLTGYTVVDSVHVEGAGFASATAEERNEVERFLKMGVIL